MTLSLADLLEVLRRRWATVFFTTILVGGGIYWAAASQAPVYEATVTIAFDRSDDPVAFRGTGEESAIGYAFLNTEQERLRSQPVIRKTLVDSGALQRPPFIDSAEPSEHLRGRIKILTSKDSWALKIRLRDEDHEQATLILDHLIRNYIAQLLEEGQRSSKEALRFLTDEMLKLDSSLQSLRSVEQRFREENQIISTDPDNNHHSRRLGDLQLKIGEFEGRITAAESLVDQVRQAESISDADARRRAFLRIERINSHPLVLQQQKKLFELRSRSALLDQQYGSDHPEMKTLVELVHAETAQLDEAIALAKEVLSTQHAEISGNHTRLATQVEAQKAVMSDYRQRLMGLQGILQDIDTQSRIRDTLLERFREREITSRLEASQVEVIDPPRALPFPVNINRKLFATVALVLGLFAGCLVALGHDLMDVRVRDAETVVRILPDPILARVAPAKDASGTIQDWLSRDPAMVERFATLATALRLCLPTRPDAQAIAICSAKSGEGKSTVAAHVAAAFASRGRRVLLVDADLHRPRQHQIFARSNEEGLSFLLAGEDDIAPRASGIANLDLLTAGPCPPNPSGLLDSDRLEQLLASWRTAYDMLVFDTPPINQSSDALVVGRYVDGVVLVVRIGQSTKRQVRRARQSLASVGIPVSGITVNSSTTSSAEGPSYAS